MPRGRSPSPRGRRHDTDERTRRHSRSRSPVPKRRRYSRSLSPPPRRSSPERRSRSRDRNRSRRERSRSVSQSSASSADRDKKKKKRRRDSKERRERKERKKEKKERKERVCLLFIFAVSSSLIASSSRRRNLPHHTGANMGSSQKPSAYLPFPSLASLTVSSIFSKGSEFHTWLVEEQKVNPETITKDQSKKHFARFVEDFNTGMFPKSRLVLESHLTVPY